MRALRAIAREPSQHPASGGFGTRMERLGLTAAEIYEISDATLARIRSWPGRETIRLAIALVDSRGFDARQVAYDLLWRQRGALEALQPADLGLLGRGMDNWATVDTFACAVSGPAWRMRRIDDPRVHRWAHSPDRWWRRAALVSTVPLNLKSRGGTGDTPRTLALCEVLVDDQDDMVEKALSWALRELAKRDAPAVAAFLERFRARIMPRVVREVGTKLASGVKRASRGPRG